MARFMVKASEYKNVCKAVNDKKLAELKKEIIEILKKQDEKEFKKAIDYLNSQELYYTHLEKSITTGKWVEKAGYGIGTVRTWKGKKYKKVAQGKWVRVFDKEGHGTNVAIGKLISKIQKCDNVEDLMALVMANKSRFVDENGVDLPILDKLRAAADIRNEKLSGESSSYTYGVGENTSREKNEIFADKDKITKEEAELHKVARKFSQMPTGELNKRKAQLERWIDNKTKSKRDHLNNTIWREKYQEELDAINDVLDKRGVKKTEKVAENKNEDKDYKYYKNNLSTNDDLENISKDIKKEKEYFNNHKDEPGAKQRLKELDAKEKVVNELLNEKPEEKKNDDSKAYEGKLATQKQVDEATAISNKYEVSRNEMLKKPITTIQKYANSTVEDFEGGIDKFIEYMAEGRSEGVSMDEVGKEFAKLINHNVARKIWDDYESGALEVNDDGVFEPKKETKEKPAESKESDYVQKKREAKEGYWSDEFKERNMNNIKQKIAAMKEDGASDKKIKAYLEETIETNTNDIPWRERAIEEGRIKGNQANDYRDTIQERTVRIENCKELLKEYETETKEKTDFDVEAYKKSKKKLEDTIADIDKKIQLYDSNPTSNGMRMAQQLENQKKEWQKQLDNLESQKKDYKKSVLGELLLLEGIEEQKEDEEEFLLDNILEEDIDDMTKEKEEESLFNDYTAEEPEEFNSTEFMVREALNRRFNCL